MDALFLQDGHWRQPPSAWGDPDKALENKDFMAVFEACMQLDAFRRAQPSSCPDAEG